ncbi:MAG: hypothetical protein KAX38_01650, partial [Candidatus Krumholzibacteria bacterium]|nr:hypothetical protein [Candidatus Krumholzibacteria bacterium]
YGLIDEEYTLPMKFRGGISLNLASLLVSTDISYIDYSQTKWEGLTLIDQFDRAGGRVLKDVWNFHVGAEFSLPMYPVRIRGGYSYTPLVISVAEYITLLDRSYDDPRDVYIWNFETARERQRFTFGIGALIDRVLTLDLAVAIGGFEKDMDFFSEERNITEVVFSSAYRF